MPMHFIAPCALAIALMLSVGSAAAQHAGHTPPSAPKHSQTPVVKPKAAPVDAHAGHQPQADPVDHTTMDHSGMDHAAMGHNPATATPPRTPIPTITDADRAAAAPPAHAHAAHDNAIHHYLLLDRLERTDGEHSNGQQWQLQGWLGTDEHRVWLRSEGERSDGHTESANVELLYGRPIARWWDALAGVRYDVHPGDAQPWLALGVTGVVPYKFELDATVYLGEKNRSAASVELEYETLLTNRLILQSALEARLHGYTDAKRGVGTGVSTLDAGLRLRYEWHRQFAPYLGVSRERAFGHTAELRDAHGEDRDSTQWLVGVRVWF